MCARSTILACIALGLTLCGTALAAAFAYITNSGSNTVSVIDTASDAVVATIPVDNQPLGVAVNATASRVYVTNRASNTVSVIDTAANAVIATIPVGAEPTGVAVNRTGTRVYVANFAVNGLTVIDAVSNTVITVVPVGLSPFGVAVNPAGTRVYVADRASAGVSIVDTTSDTVLTTLGAGFGPNGIAVDAAGARVYVGSTTDPGITVIDAATSSVVTTLPTGTAIAYAVATNSSGTQVYARTVTNTVVVNENVAGTPVTWEVNVGAGPGGIAATPDDKRLYAVNSGANSVSVVDLATRSVVATIPVGVAPNAFGQAIGPAGAGAVANYQGLWWASGGSESGWGINFAHSADQIFATWYTYDTAGKAWWLSMLANRTTPTSNIYSGPIYVDAGPPFNNYVGIPTPAVVGTGTLTFADLNTATFAYTINTTTPATTQTKSIARYDLATGPQPTCAYSAGTPNFAAATNYQDLWWVADSAETGWGVNFAHQGNALFATWYTYDVDGTPLWLSALTPRVGGSNVYSGPIYRTSGPRFDAFDTTKVVPVQVGTVTLTFADGNHATFAYATNGAGSLPAVSQSKAITRFPFAASGGTVCN